MSQIFSEYVPYEILLYIFDEYCVRLEKPSGKIIYKINNSTHKKNSFNKKISPLLHDISGYYRPNKLTYIKNGTTYRGFLTILRQLCKLWEIPYEKNVKYDKNTYDIEYFFFP
jgi:hypothetical protein